MFSQFLRSAQQRHCAALRQGGKTTYSTDHTDAQRCRLCFESRKTFGKERVLAGGRGERRVDEGAVLGYRRSRGSIREPAAPKPLRRVPMSVTSAHAITAASMLLLVFSSGARAQEAAAEEKTPADQGVAAEEKTPAEDVPSPEPAADRELIDDPEVRLPEPPEQGDARARVTLREAVDEAMRHSADVERADAVVHESQAARKQVRGRYGPTLSVNGNVRVWNEAAEVEFDVPGGMMPMTPMAGPSVIPIRDQVTADFTATLAQPLTGLWRIHQSHGALSKQVSASRADREATQHDVALRVSQAYFDALKSEKLSEIAQVTVEQLEAHLARARAFHEMGLISRNEVLETQVRLAEAKADLIEARGTVTLSRSRLAYRMGLPSDRPIAPAPVDEERELAPPPESYEASAQRATAQRADLESTRHRIEAAESSVDAAKASMLPELSAVASYQHVAGQALAIRNQAFVGAQLSWNLWEWGATYYGIEEAQAQAAQARAMKRQQEEGIKLEVRQAYVQLQSAREQLEVARQSVEQAEENLRVVQHRFEANAATSTEVLDAQALLAQARVRKTTAHYDYLSAKAALERAVGKHPVPDVMADGMAR